MVALGVEGIAHHIRTVGLFNTKAKNVHKLSQILIDEHGGEVPSDRARSRLFRAWGGRQQTWC